MNKMNLVNLALAGVMNTGLYMATAICKSKVVKPAVIKVFKLKRRH